MINDPEMLDYEDDTPRSPAQETLSGYKVSECDTPGVEPEGTAQASDADEQQDIDSDLAAAADTVAVRAVAPSGRQPIPAPARAAKHPTLPKLYGYLADTAADIQRLHIDREAAATSAARAATAAAAARATSVSIVMKSGPFSEAPRVYDVTSAAGHSAGMEAVATTTCSASTSPPLSCVTGWQKCQSGSERSASYKLLQASAVGDSERGHRISSMLGSASNP